MSIRLYQPAHQLTQRIETRAAVTNLSTVKMFDPYAPTSNIAVDVSSICNIPVVEAPQNATDYLVYRESVRGLAWEPHAPGPMGPAGAVGPIGATGPASDPFNFEVETVAPASPITTLNPDKNITFVNAPSATLFGSPVADGQIKTIINLYNILPVNIDIPGGFYVDGVDNSIMQFNAVGSVAKMIWSSNLNRWVVLSRNNVSFG